MPPSFVVSEAYDWFGNLAGCCGFGVWVFGSGALRAGKPSGEPLSPCGRSERLSRSAGIIAPYGGRCDRIWGAAAWGQAALRMIRRAGTAGRRGRRPLRMGSAGRRGTPAPTGGEREPSGTPAPTGGERGPSGSPAPTEAAICGPSGTPAPTGGIPLDLPQTTRGALAGASCCLHFVSYLLYFFSYLLCSSQKRRMLEGFSTRSTSLPASSTSRVGAWRTPYCLARAGSLSTTTVS